jgi:hypothetical protein
MSDIDISRDECERRADMSARFHDVVGVPELILALRAALDRAEADKAAAVEAKDAAYLERNHLVALLARIYPSGVKRTAIPGWSDDWHGCVYIDFPWGQASWHFHDSQAWLFDGLPPYVGEWDGHDTAGKYAAIVAALPTPAPMTVAQAARVPEVAVLKALGEEYILMHPRETNEDRMGRHSAIRGVAVRLGIYPELEAAIVTRITEAKP